MNKAVFPWDVPSSRIYCNVRLPDHTESCCRIEEAQLHLPGRYAMQDLLAPGVLPYNIRMSGLMVNSPDKRGKLFLTISQPDRIIGELLELNGYAILGSNE
jgi:hypothetical protein